MSDQKTLLIDIGNSLIKFAMIDSSSNFSTNQPQPFQSSRFLNNRFDQVQSINHQSNHDWLQFENLLAKEKFNRVLIASVASQEPIKQNLIEKLFAIQTNHLIINNLKSQAEFESNQFRLINGYDQPIQLGVDRWLAMIAAIYDHQQSSQKSKKSKLAVIDLGSVISIDFVEKSATEGKTYHHLGGLLIPNYQLNQATLSKKMPLERMDHQSIKFQQNQSRTYGKNTQDCIEIGFFYSLKYLLDQHPQLQDSQLIYLTGGFSQSFKKAIQTDARFIFKSNLVIIGLMIQSLKSMQP